MRDPASWLPLATGLSSRNMVFTFQLSTVIPLQARSAFGLTMFGDNRIIVVGGMGAEKNALDSIEELSEDGTHWTPISTDLQYTVGHPLSCDIL